MHFGLALCAQLLLHASSVKHAAHMLFEEVNLW